MFNKQEKAEKVKTSIDFTIKIVQRRLAKFHPLILFKNAILPFCLGFYTIAYSNNYRIGYTVASFCYLILLFILLKRKKFYQLYIPDAFLRTLFKVLLILVILVPSVFFLIISISSQILCLIIILAFIILAGPFWNDIITKQYS